MSYRHSMAVANKLKYYREQCGLSQDKVAKQLKVNRSTYAYYEVGRVIPCVEKLILIADIFNISYTDLLDDYYEEIMQKRRAEAADELL